MECRGRPHRKSRDIPWDAHCLTFSCFRRQPFFTGQQAPGWFLECIDIARRNARFELWAWVIMPEHVHLVLCPHEGVAMRQILWHLKKPLSDRVLEHVRRDCPGFLPRMADVQPNGRTSYRFWQRGGGYDRNLRSVKDTHEKIRYVHGNPVRRGLVLRPEDWPWSSASDWLGLRPAPIRLDLDTLSPPS